MAPALKANTSRPEEGGSAGGENGSRVAAPNADISEDEALALLQTAEVTASTLADLGRNANLLKSRKATMALVKHGRTPRHVSVPLLRRIFTFDLMTLTLAPAVAADIKRAAEDQILLRLESLSTGEKISLARRASGRIAAELLQEGDQRIISTALDNSRLSEAHVVVALMKRRAPEQLFILASNHGKWMHRREVQVALLRSEKTPLERAKEMAKNFSQDALRDIVPDSRLPEISS